MFKKHMALVMVMVTVLSMTSCATADPDMSSPEETQLTEAKENIYDEIDKIAKNLADCNYESFEKRCVEGKASKLKAAMPTIDIKGDPHDEIPLVDRVDKELMIKNMIAGTITYEIKDDTFNAGFLSLKPSVDVVFSYKDYHKVIKEKSEFLGPAEFNTLLADVEKTVDFTVTLNFKRDGVKYYLDNPEDLAVIYEYTDTKLEYMEGLFDMIDKIYLSGPGYDPATDSFTDTNTIEIVFKLNFKAQDYIWNYKWAFALETYPKWTYLKISDEIMDRYPKEIHVTYTQDENIAEGTYAFVLYDPQQRVMRGLEFDVHNTGT